MTNYEMLLSINDKTRANIDSLNSSGKMNDLSKCVAFADDLQLWVSSCDTFSCLPLVKEAQSKFVCSVFLCAQGFYKAAISALRQCLEHMLFSIMLSTNDYKYRLWKAGQYDMSWTQLMDGENGVFGLQFIRVYAPDLDESRSIELLTIAKNVYRECSEYIHGNYEKLIALSETLEYDERALDYYMQCFSSIQYLICMALFIRFRYILENSTIIRRLEPIIADTLGSLPEVQLVFSHEGEEKHE